jgi:hypothetical protein
MSYEKVSLKLRKTLLGKSSIYLDFLDVLLFEAFDFEEFSWFFSDLEPVMDLSSLFFVVAILFRIKLSCF